MEHSLERHLRSDARFTSNEVAEAFAVVGRGVAIPYMN